MVRASRYIFDNTSFFSGCFGALTCALNRSKRAVEEDLSSLSLGKNFPSPWQERARAARKDPKVLRAPRVRRQLRGRGMEGFCWNNHLSFFATSFSFEMPKNVAGGAFRLALHKFRGFKILVVSSITRDCKVWSCSHFNRICKSLFICMYIYIYTHLYMYITCPF